MASPPTITSSVAPTIPSYVMLNWDNSKLLLLNGAWAVAGATYPDQYMGIPSNIWYGSTSYGGSVGAIEFDLTGSRFEVCTKGTGTAYRIIVDGEVSSNAFPTYTNDGGLKYTKIDFGSTATRRIRFEAISNRAYVANFFFDPSATVTKPASYGQRLVMIGDSFTEGIGATNIASSLSVQIAQELGFKDFWSSGSGGTGWVNPGSGRIGGFARWTTDVVNRLPSMVLCMLGINDTSQSYESTIQSTLPTKLAELRAANPNVLVHVVGCFNPSYPATLTGLDAMDAALQAATVGQPRTWFHSIKDIGFTKSDATHPAASGHVTLYKAIYNKIAAVHGLHMVA